MKYALVSGERREAERGLLGTCPSCDQLMVAKCGEVKIKHWSHKGRRTCDPWWENETEWHRDWKAHFPEEWQEVVHRAEDGERHIADVKTDQGWTIEFQHSYLKPEERKTRNAFYKKLIWVVNGKRLKGDEQRLTKALGNAANIGPILKIHTGECSLLRDWSGSHAPIFFDFGKSLTNPERSVLWVLLPKSPDGMAYLFPYLRSDFVEISLQGASPKALEFMKLLSDWPGLVQTHNRQPMNQLRAQPVYSYVPQRRRRF